MATPISGPRPSMPPALAAERPVVWPRRTVRTLANGLQVVLVESHTIPKFTAQLLFRSGNAAVALESPGLAEITAAVVRTGTAGRASRQIEEDLRRMGADLSTSAGADSSSISLSGLSEFSDGLLELVADLAQSASFPAEEFERERRQRLDELKINIANTTIFSPVSGFIAKRTLDPGAWVTPNSAFMSIVDITLVRLVANVVEKDLRRMKPGLPARVEVDAYPGETFAGQVARVSPVLDPATRTAQIEVEILNPLFRLKPGMYAKVNFTVEHREKTLVVPTAALVDMGGNRGVFLPDKNDQGDIATFKKIEVGLIDQNLAEVASGLTEGETVVTTGAGALRQGDRIVLPGQPQPGAGAGAAGGPRGRSGGRGGAGRGGRGVAGRGATGGPGGNAGGGRS